MEKAIYQQTYDFEKEYWWYSGRRNLLLDFFYAYRNPDGNLKILDAGCGTGYTLNEISSSGIVFGVDFSMEAIRLANKRNLHHLQRASLINLPFRNNTFDWIFSWDVLEHIDNDDIAINELRRVCKKGGFLILSVPAHPFLWSGEDVVSRHKRRYTKNSFRLLIENANLKIIKLTHFNFMLLPVIISVIFKKRILSQFGSNLKPLPNWLNNFLRLIFEFERPILKSMNMPFGLSIFCIAQKNRD